MKHNIKIGLATHYRKYTEEYSRKITACGMVIHDDDRVTRDVCLVDCIRCQKTRQYRRVA